MVVAADHLANTRESTRDVDMAVETVVGTTGRFNGKDVMNYLEALKKRC